MKRTVFPRAAFFLVLLLLLSLAGCQPAEKEAQTTPMDPLFLKHTSLSDKDLASFQPYLQDVNVSATYGENTLRITQVVSDAVNLSLAMYLEGPELKDFVGSFSDDEDMTTPSDILTWASCGIFSRTFSAEELEGETLYPLVLAHSADFLSSSLGPSSSFLDTENDRLSCRTSVHLGYSTLPSDKMTLVIEGLEYKLNGEYHKLTDELIVLSWPMKPQNDFFERDLKDKDGHMVGRIRLAPFSLDLSLSESNFSSIEEVFESVGFMKKNGAYLPLSSPGFSGDGSSSEDGGAYDLSLRFQKPIPVTDGKSILVGDYKADLRE